MKAIVAVMVVLLATASSAAYAAGPEAGRVGADLAVRAALAESTWLHARPARAVGPAEVDSPPDPPGALVTALDVAASLAAGVPLGLLVVHRKSHPVRASVSRTGVQVEVRF